MPPALASPVFGRFWRDPLGLDLAIARVRPGGKELEIHFRGGQAYQVAVSKLGAGPMAAFAGLGANPRVVVLGLPGATCVDLPVERVLAACEPTFRREWRARAVGTTPVGVRVREVRRASGQTAMAVAAAAGMARSNYARLEAGRHEPRLATLRRVAAVLRVPVSVFFDGPVRRFKR